MTKNQISQRSLLIWRYLQTLVFIFGLFILFNLIFFQKLGLTLFWNILIPVAPALLVIAVGVWRNVCPLGSLSLLPRHSGLSKRKRLTVEQSGALSLIAVIALLILAPLRHVLFDISGIATALLIMIVGVIAVITGFYFEWKSAWCSGLCPIYPVEKLYGMSNRFSIPNVQCDQCYRCVTPCPDTTPGYTPFTAANTTYHKIAGSIMVGGFPGFVWGWFQVPTMKEKLVLEQLLLVYNMPILGLVSTLLLFLILKRFFPTGKLVSVFAASAVSCYYWFKLPSWFGYGVFPGDGMLIDLSGILPEWSLTLLVCTTTLFFFWWIVFNKQNRNSWEIKPAYANEQ